MNNRSKRYVAGGYALSTALLAPAVAGAVTSYQGNDYSQDFESYTKMKVCDMETDGKKVHADVDLTDSYELRVEDGDGGGNACAYGGPWKTPENKVLHIQRHRTVESAYLGDLLGDWEDTGY